MMSIAGRSKWRGVSVAVVFLGMFAMSVFAGDKIVFKEAGEYQAKGEAKEVKVSQAVRYCRIDVVEGTVIINTIVIREGGKKTPIKVVAKLQKDAKHVVDFGKIHNITGIRISDDSGGKYKVMLGK
jgi:hypothetical protein